MKSVEIITTYGSTIFIAECLHIDVTVGQINILYIDYYSIKEMVIDLSRIAKINIENRASK